MTRPAVEKYEARSVRYANIFLRRELPRAINMSDPRILALPGNEKEEKKKKRKEKRKKGRKKKKAAEKYSLRKYRSNNLSAHVARKKLSKAIYGEIYRYVGHRCIIHSALGADPIHSVCDFASTGGEDQFAENVRPRARERESKRERERERFLHPRETRSVAIRVTSIQRLRSNAFRVQGR